MKKRRFVLGLALISCLIIFSSCDDDGRRVDVEYEYQLEQGTHHDISGTIQYVDARGNLVSGGSVSRIPFKASFEADRGFDDVKMVVTLNPLPETTTTPINLVQVIDLELEDIERTSIVAKSFDTVDEYNNFAQTPQIFVIE
jgi:hypothetical protein